MNFYNVILKLTHRWYRMLFLQSESTETKFQTWLRKKGDYK